jgi:hypothetical protein
VGGEAGQVRLELADGVPEAAGDRLSGALGWVAREGSPAVSQPGDAAELVDEGLALHFDACLPLQVAAVGRLGGIRLERAEPMAVGEDGLAVGDVSCVTDRSATT